MGQSNESVVSQASINARAEALEKKEAEVAAGKGKEGEEGKSGAEGQEGDAAAKAKADKDASDKAAADKAASEKAEADRKAAEASKSGKPAKEKREPNDPEELRKWNTRNSQENKKLRDELAAVKEAQEKTYKLLASLSKKPVDYKELAKSPEAVEKFVESERESMATEFQAELERLSTEAKTKDTMVERMRREQDTENYPEWKRLYPAIVKIALGPTGQGDPRVDFTKPASEVLDHLYEIALQENPKGAEPVQPQGEDRKFTEAEVKAMVADMVSKERESISKSAREEAAKEAQEALRREAAGSTVASSGKGAGRVPTDHLQAFRKMSLAEQRDWLIAQQQNNA